MNKKDLRIQYKKIRKEINDRDIQNKYIFNHIISDKQISNATTILIYVSYNDEVDTIELIKYFLNRKRVAVPKVFNDNMDFYYINSIDELREGYAGILEPTTNDMVSDFSNCVCIVPGICFDNNNYRVGYGKGFYDRFLSDKNIYTIGLSYRECIVDRIDIDKYDIKLKKVIYKK